MKMFFLISVSGRATYITCRICEFVDVIYTYIIHIDNGLRNREHIFWSTVLIKITFSIRLKVKYKRQRGRH